MTEAPKPRTLRDYARFLRRNWWVVAATVVVAVGVAVALTVTQPKKYSASTQVYFPDPLSNAGIVGEQASGTAPATLAADGVARLTSTSTLAKVKKALKTPLSISQLKSDLSSTTDPNSFVVTVTATASTPSLAADLANTATSETKAQANAAASRQFAQMARTFKTQINGLSSSQRKDQAIVSALYDNYSRAASLARGGTVAAQIQSGASVPSSPSSPKPVTDAFVAAIAGLVLGLIIAGMREAFDRRLRGPKEIEADLRLPILGQIREEALGRSPGFANDKPRVNEFDLEAFRILRTNLEFLAGDKPITTIAVTSALPEEGKTTVASSLAFTLAVAGRRTLLVECDLRRPTLAKRLGIAPAPGLTDFLVGSSQPQDVVRPFRVGFRGDLGNGNSASGGMGPPGGLACITAGSRTERPTELFASDAFNQFLAEVAEAYDTVILDTAPMLPVADTLQILPDVDAVLVCLRASRTTREQAIAARTALSRLPERPGGVVLTGARDRHDYSSYYPYAYSYGYSDDGWEREGSGPTAEHANA